jgi:hypothetical protein
MARLPRRLMCKVNSSWYQVIPRVVTGGIWHWSECLGWDRAVRGKTFELPKRGFRELDTRNVPIADL